MTRTAAIRECMNLLHKETGLKNLERDAPIDKVWGRAGVIYLQHGGGDGLGVTRPLVVKERLKWLKVNGFTVPPALSRKSSWEGDSTEVECRKVYQKITSSGIRLKENAKTANGCKCVELNVKARSVSDRLGGVKETLVLLDKLKLE